jgi:hypothetical protein
MLQKDELCSAGRVRDSSVAQQAAKPVSDMKAERNKTEYLREQLSR